MYKFIGKKVKILIVLIALLFIAAILDFYKGKIPNALVLSGCCYGLVRLLKDGNVINYIPGILFSIIMFFPFYRIGVIGAGDIKLLSMLGFYFSFSELIFCVFASFAIGALVSIISFIRYDNFFERMSYLFSYLNECFRVGYFQYYYLNSKEEAYKDKKSLSKIHFAFPIFISVLLHIGGVF